MEKSKNNSQAMSSSFSGSVAKRNQPNQVHFTTVYRGVKRRLNR